MISIKLPLYSIQRPGCLLAYPALFNITFAGPKTSVGSPRLSPRHCDAL